MPQQITGFILVSIFCFVGVVLIIGIAELINYYRGNKTVFRIKIEDLEKAIKKLNNKKKKLAFIGLMTSKGYDCIYIVKRDHFFIEYEVIEEIQLFYLEKLHLYAIEHGYKINITTHGNIPLYKTEETATVLQIDTEDASLEELLNIIKDIQKMIFENAPDTEYEFIS